ncbi:AraC family transcriptional regulator [Cohnella herbarum]|uniref:AraC family transcriptional regulator n=1 Tax=Cohnella herbarum TaxID=2728023 RepID=A0A7Z2VMU1_9BACL|nr:helix-turn-helix domain-containing protein [Cohnella herbarum]QJD86163.1 AraC family transcriptional regulator [Cohnella herbarum]
MDHLCYKSNPIHISREKTTQCGRSEFHRHDAYEIQYTVSGNLYSSIEDKTYQTVGGVLLLINRNDKHRSMNANGSEYEKVTLLFQKEVLRSLLQENEDFDPLSCFRSGSSAIKLGGREQDFIEELFRKMIAEHQKNLPGSHYYRKIMLAELLLFIKRKLDSSQRYDLIESNLAHKAISQAVNFINQNFYQRLTLDDVSKKFFLSASYLSRTFKPATGYTFIEYINTIRVKEARSLLSNSELSISEIADRVGYANLTHFGRVFKSITGFSPMKYRQKNRLFLKDGLFP